VNKREREREREVREGERERERGERNQSSRGKNFLREILFIFLYVGVYFIQDDTHYLRRMCFSHQNFFPCQQKQQLGNKNSNGSILPDVPYVAKENVL
jgi:hypothetical protein